MHIQLVTLKTHAWKSSGSHPALPSSADFSDYILTINHWIRYKLTLNDSLSPNTMLY